jgi:hypothetical protein
VTTPARTRRSPLLDATTATLPDPVTAAADIDDDELDLDADPALTGADDEADTAQDGTPPADATAGQFVPVGGPEYGNGASAYLDELLSDLTTYRYVPQVSVTPALARRLIGLNSENNRTYAPKRGGMYTRDMRNGKWREKTGQTLKIGTDGRLLDGNHRAHAVAESGQTIVFDLCFGIEPKDILVMDGHKPRGLADAIRVAGGVDLYRQGSVVAYVWAFRKGAVMGPNALLRPTATEAAETYAADKDLFDAATKRGFDCQGRNLGPASAAGTAYFLFAEKNKEETERFFDALVSGIYNVPDPNILSIYHLRERLIRRKHDRLTRPEMLAMFIRAWNRRHEVVTKLQISRDELTTANFPRPGK